METVRRGRDADLPQIQALWAECFGADRFCDWFFMRLYAPSLLRVLEVDGAIVSMAFCFPRKVLFDHTEVPAWYLYGIGTTASARGNGFAKRLITVCTEEAKQNGIKLCFLIPAEQSLFSFYSACGFTKIFSREKTQGKVFVTQSELTLKSVDVADLPQVNEMYETAFRARVKREIRDWQLIAEDFRMGGGDVCLIHRFGEPIGYCCILCENSGVNVRELGLISEESPEKVCEQLALLNKVDRWTRTAPGVGEPFAAAILLDCCTMNGFDVNCDLMYN